MPNKKFIDEFRKSADECYQKSKDSFGLDCANGYRFDLTPCKELLHLDSHKRLQSLFEFGAKGESETITPTVRSLWLNGKPPQYIKFTSDRVFNGYLIIKVSVSETICSKGELSNIKVENG